MERALRIFSLLVQLMIHPVFTHSTNNLEAYPGHEWNSAAVYSKLLKCLLETQILPIYGKIKPERANSAISDTHRTNETPISVSILFQPHPLHIITNLKTSSPVCLVVLVTQSQLLPNCSHREDVFFFSLVMMIYYSNEVTEMPAVDFWNR